MKKLLQNALESIFTTIAGGVAGVAEIRSGIENNEPNTIIIGVGLLLLGLFAKEK